MARAVNAAPRRIRPTFMSPVRVSGWIVCTQVIAHGVAVFNHPLRRRQDQDTLAETAQPDPIEFPFDRINRRCRPRCSASMVVAAARCVVGGSRWRGTRAGRPWWWKTAGIWS